VETVLNPSVVEIIQLALAPIFLIVGIGNLVNVATGRVSRIIDRARWFGNLAREQPERINEKAILEIRSLNKRMTFANWSINFLIGSAVITCLSVMLIMVNGLISVNLDLLVIITFMTCLLFLTGGLIAFFLEVSLATATLKIRAVDLSQFKNDKL
jgi:hypothetical protein